MHGVIYHRIGKAWHTLLVLAACGVLAGSARLSEASCGDWLVGHDMAAGHGIHDSGAIARPEVQPSAEQPASPAGRSGCRGASCSKSPIAPLTPAGDPTWEPAPGRWACLVSDGVSLALRRDRMAADDACFVPAGPCGRIDRPPRLG